MDTPRHNPDIPQPGDRDEVDAAYDALMLEATHGKEDERESRVNAIEDWLGWLVLDEKISEEDAEQVLLRVRGVVNPNSIPAGTVIKTTDRPRLNAICAALMSLEKSLADTQPGSRFRSRKFQLQQIEQGQQPHDPDVKDEIFTILETLALIVDAEPLNFEDGEHVSRLLDEYTEGKQARATYKKLKDQLETRVIEDMTTHFGRRDETRAVAEQILYLAATQNIPRLRAQAHDLAIKNVRKVYPDWDAIKIVETCFGWIEEARGSE